MGHAVEFFTIEKREYILAEAQWFAEVNVDREENPFGDYHGNLTIHDNIICDDYDDAVKKIEALDKGWYDDHAVQYRVYPEVPKTKTQIRLETRAEKNRKDRDAYVEKHSLEKLKAKAITCRNCSSKITKSFLNGRTHCPVCKSDLRAEYILERIKKFDKDFSEIHKLIRQCEKKAQAKSQKQAKIMWLAKFEVHV